jgi:hypothetical protein
MKKIFLALFGLVSYFFGNIIFSMVLAAEKNSCRYLDAEEAAAVKEAYQSKWLHSEIRWNLRGFGIFAAVMVFIIIAQVAGIEIAGAVQTASVGLTLLVQSRKKIAS